MTSFNDIVGTVAGTALITPGSMSPVVAAETVPVPEVVQLSEGKWVPEPPTLAKPGSILAGLESAMVDFRIGKMYQLVEIYESVKGEGTQAGMPMLFVRFSKCNLACSWCDTPYNRVAIKLNRGQLVDIIRSHDPAWVIFTGGEPCLQLDAPLCKKLHDEGIRMAIETNGMIWTEALRLMDYINISPKPGEPVHKIIAGEIEADEVRFTLADGQKDIWNVVTGEAVGGAKGNIEKLIGMKTKSITLSPLMEDLVAPTVGWKSGDGYKSEYGKVDQGSLNQCLALVQKYKHYRTRLSVQVHKFIAQR